MQARDQERETLSQYSGFGGIKAILNPFGRGDDLQNWSKSDHELYPLVEKFHWVLIC